MGALEFVHSPKKVLGNLARHLKEDGFIVLLVPMKTMLGYNYKLAHYFHGIHIRIFSLPEIKLPLYKSGLEIEEIVKICGLSCIIKIRPAQGVKLRLC